MNGKLAYTVGDKAHLLVCLTPDVTLEAVEAMEDLTPGENVIAREYFTDDTVIANAVNVYYFLRDRKIELNLV